MTTNALGELMAPAHTRVRLVHRTRGGAASNQATYRYAKTELAPQTFTAIHRGQTILVPGCEFAVIEGKKIFSALLLFKDPDPDTAQYDFFELLPDQTLEPLFFVTKAEGNLVKVTVVGETQLPDRPVLSMTQRSLPNRKRGQ
jgi:hypothetical protein